jgi:hypothetical protein
MIILLDSSLKIIRIIVINSISDLMLYSYETLAHIIPYLSGNGAFFFFFFLSIIVLAKQRMHNSIK